MTQPPLTQAVHKLEQALGVSLFERTSRSVSLSPAGAALLPAARALLAQAADLQPLVQAAALGTAGRLRLAFVSTVGYGELPGWLRLFRERYPDISLSLREATLDVQLQAFDSGDVDAGFILHAPGAVPPGFEHLRLAAEPLMLALSAEVELARRPDLSLAEVLPMPLVIFPRDIAPSLFDAIVGLYRGRGQEPRIQQEAIQMQTIVNLVSAGMGVAWVPASVLGFARAGVVYRSLVDAESRMPVCETSLIWRAGAAPTVQRFVEHVASHACPGSPG